MAIIGAPGDDERAIAAGAAYVFDTTTGHQLFKLTALDAAYDDRFGTSVAIDGNIAIVSTPDHDGGGTNSGAAYVFDATTGQQLFKLMPSDPTAFAAFGNSVALSGNTAIVGAYLKDDIGDNAGTAYVFDVSTGLQLQKFTASDARANDLFGFSVAVNEKLAVISAHRDVGTNPGSGSIYVFDVNTGLQLFRLTGSDTIDEDNFGRAVAIGNRRILVGAYGAGPAESGAAYVFLVVPEPAAIWLACCGSMVLITTKRRSMLAKF